MYREFIGPMLEAKINLTYHVGRIRRGQRIKVTPEEAAAMDRLPKSWRVPAIENSIPVTADVQVTRVSTKRRKRKSQKKGV